MRITQFGKKGFARIESEHLFKFHTATLVVLAVVALSAIIVLAWFNGEGTITRIFSQINAFEQKPPMWLAVPMVALKYLLLPTVAAFIALLVSEIGAEIALTQKPLMDLVVNQKVNIEILESDLQLEGTITNTGFKDEFPILRIQFESITLNQHRSLVKILFCRPGQWKRYCTPNEFSSLLLLLRILFRPRVLFERNLDISVIKVTKV